VDVLKSLLSFLLMMCAVAVIIGLLAGLFMIVFSIATGVDEHLQE
jgi:flagellar biosynthesis protein FliQ